MKRSCMATACALLVTLGAQGARADLINGQFVPHELVGTYQTYRLIFVTAGTSLGTPTDKTSYDTFVQEEAEKSELFAGKSDLYQWQALVTVRNGGTPVCNVRDILTGITTPFYNLGLGGQKVAVDGPDMYDAADALLAAPNYNQHAQDAGQTLVWTGGLTQPPSGTTPVPSTGWLGDGPTAWVGNSWMTNSDWAKAAEESKINQDGSGRGLAIYAISGELVAVPEPSTVVLWSLFSGIAGLACWRKRRATK